jgi:hypothetical protein
MTGSLSKEIQFSFDEIKMKKMLEQMFLNSL